MKKVFVIAGPNGAGKTTTAFSLISEGMIEEFLNADEIARGLAPLHPESVALAASKLMIVRLKKLLSEDKSFAFETTGAGTNYVKHLKEAKKNGYQIDLIYLWLSDPELAVKRVMKRVAQGGHHIPHDVVRRRYQLGLRNVIKHYLLLADNILILDNSKKIGKRIAQKEHQKTIEIIDLKVWNKIKSLSDDP